LKKRFAHKQPKMIKRTNPFQGDPKIVSDSEVQNRNRNIIKDYWSLEY